MRKLTLYIIRHAPVIAPKGLIYGHTNFDCDTSDSARTTWLRDQVPGDAPALVSGLKRTRQTLKAVLPDAEPDALPALNEQYFGEWEQKPLKELGRDHPIWADPAGFTPPGGESWSDVRTRVAAALPEILNADDGCEAKIIVAHHGSIRALLAEALALDDLQAMRLAVDTLGLCRIHYFGGSAPFAGSNWRVDLING